MFAQPTAYKQLLELSQVQNYHFTNWLVTTLTMKFMRGCNHNSTGTGPSTGHTNLLFWTECKIQPWTFKGVKKKLEIFSWQRYYQTPCEKLGSYCQPSNYKVLTPIPVLPRCDSETHSSQVQ